MDRRSPSATSATWTPSVGGRPVASSPDTNHPLPPLPPPPPHTQDPSPSTSHRSPRELQSSWTQSSSHSQSPPRLSTHPSHQSSTSSTSASSSSHSHKLPKFLRRDKDKRKGSTDEAVEDRGRSVSGGGAGADGRHERMTGLQQSGSSYRPSHLSPPLDGSGSFAASTSGAPSSYNSPPKKSAKSSSKMLRKKGSKLFGSSSQSSAATVDAPGPSPRDEHSPRSLGRPGSPTSISTTSSAANVSDPMIIIEPPPSATNSSNRRHLSTPAGPPSRRSTSATVQPRPVSSVSTSANHPNSPYSQSNGSSTRLGEIASAIPTRLGGWFSNFLPAASTSSTSLATIPPSLHQQQQHPQQSSPSAPSPPRNQSSRSILTAAKEKGAIMRYLLDSDAGKPEKCEDGIWVMGTLHEGWRPANGPTSPRNEKDEVDAFSNPISPPRKQALQRHTNGGSPASPGKFTNLFSTSALSLASHPTAQEGSPSTSTSSPRREKKAKEEVRWPEEFFDDFRTSIWCTYRSQYAPITHLPPHLLVPSPSSYDADGLPLPALVRESVEAMRRPPIARPSTGWAWVKGGGDDKGLSTDSGWGCMLRTGQSLLANSLVRLYLGRAWRKPAIAPTESTASTAKEVEDYATYVRILSWFMDDPLPHAPFSVHRMALVGKQLGKEVGEWFGPSTAAGAIKTLTNAYPHAALSVSLAADAVIFRSDVYAASQPIDSSHSSPEKRAKSGGRRWGGRAVLVLVGVRLGLDGVNPIYHETVKNLFTFPQSVGIAGGRPSSSYYFLGYQAESLFYLDPHHTRPAVVLNVPPTREELVAASAARADAEEEARIANELSANRESSIEPEEHAYASASEVDTVLADSRRVSVLGGPGSALPPHHGLAPQDVPLPPTPPLPSHYRTPSTSSAPLPRFSDSPTPFSSSTAPSSLPPPAASAAPLDPLLEWYATAYPEASLQTFHCDKVRKMAFSQLDPSMLLGFLCRDEDEWDDFCVRVANMPNAIFSIADEPCRWDDDDDAGLESFSETDPDGFSTRSSAHSRSPTDFDRASLEDDPDIDNDDDGGDGDSQLYPSPTPAHARPQPRHFSTASEDVVLIDSSLGVEILPASHTHSSSSSPSSLAPPQPDEPSTPTSTSSRSRPPPPSRALGSEFELLGEEDWLVPEDDEAGAGVTPGKMGSASMRRKDKMSSLPFPSEGEEEDDGEGEGGEGGEGSAKTERTRRGAGKRAVSGVTVTGRDRDRDRKGLEMEEDEDDF